MATPSGPGLYSRQCHVARRAAAVWCPSAASAADVTQRFGVDAVEVPFCYDSGRFTFAGDRAHTPSMQLISVSRLVPHKNHAAVIRAAALISPVPGVRIIGAGPEAAALRSLAAAVGVSLTLADGWLHDVDIVAAYRTAAVVVAPSRFEGFGLSPIEGIAVGTPVVASDIPPHREFAGRAATLVPLDDDAAMAAAIRSAISRGPAVVPPETIGELTIDACATRLRARFAAWL